MLKELKLNVFYHIKESLGGRSNERKKERDEEEKIGIINDCEELFTGIKSSKMHCIKVNKIDY